MATVIPNTKDGKTLSFKFRAYLGKDEAGKPINKYTTWYVPDDMKPARAQRTAEKAAEEWEKEVRDEYEKDLKDPERVRQREIAKTHTDFADFILNTWFPIRVCDGEHKPTTVNFYRHIAIKLADYFKGKTIQQIASTDIQKYLIYLRTIPYTTGQAYGKQNHTTPVLRFDADILLCGGAGNHFEEPYGQGGLPEAVPEKGGRIFTGTGANPLFPASKMPARFSLHDVSADNHRYPPGRTHGLTMAGY